MGKTAKRIILGIVCIAALIMVFVGLRMHSDDEDDIKNAIDAAWGNTDTDDAPAYLQEITRLSTYEIISIEEDGWCTINVVVKGIDLGSKLKELSPEDYPQTEDEDVLNDYFLEIIKTCEIVETPAEIYAEPSSEGYEITFSDTFVDAMSGKVYSYYMGVLEDMLEG